MGSRGPTPGQLAQWYRLVEGDPGSTEPIDAIERLLGRIIAGQGVHASEVSNSPV